MLLSQRIDKGKKNDAHATKVGDLTPDFELADITGETLVRLSDFRGRKSVAPILVSFT